MKILKAIMIIIGVLNIIFMVVMVIFGTINLSAGNIYLGILEYVLAAINILSAINIFVTLRIP